MTLSRPTGRDGFAAAVRDEARVKEALAHAQEQIRLIEVQERLEHPDTAYWDVLQAQKAAYGQMADEIAAALEARRESLMGWDEFAPETWAEARP